MYASSFGVPIPEELTLVTVGFLVYLGMNPQLYPMSAGGEPLNVHITAVVCFAAVLSSDFLVYCIGRRYGRKALEFSFLKKYSLQNG